MVLVFHCFSFFSGRRMKDRLQRKKLTVYRKLLLDQPLEDFASEGFSGILYAVIFTHWFVFATSLLNYTSSFHIFSFFSSPYLIEQFHDFSSSNGFSTKDLRFFECKGIFFCQQHKAIPSKLKVCSRFYQFVSFR